MAGNWIILDNGVAEGHQYGLEELVPLAHEIGASEIVLPDVMGKSRATIDAVRASATLIDPAFTYIGVVQGSSMLEAICCAKDLLLFPYVTRLALPRILNKKIGPHARSDLATHLWNLGIQCDLHALGASATVDEVKSFPSNITSMDTSMPISAGYLEWRIDDPDYGTYDAQPKGYFSFGSPTPNQWECIVYNCRTFYKWANPKTSESTLRELFPQHPIESILPFSGS